MESRRVIPNMIMFIINSILLGVGLAMDAFSVSLANGLNAPKMSRGMRALANGLNAPKMSRGMRAAVPLTFGGFQFLMPMIGWFCVRRLAEAFEAFQAAVPWIALGVWQRHSRPSRLLSRGSRSSFCCSSAERCSSTGSGATKSRRSNSWGRAR